MTSLSSLSLLKRAFTEMEKWANKLIVNKEKPQHLFATALYIKICELTAGCIILIDCKVTTGVPILVRGILEAYVDLINLCKDSAYIKSMEVSYFEEWLRILKEAKNNQNSNLCGTFQVEDLSAHIDIFQEELKRLKKEGFKVLSAKERFNNAGMGKEYSANYNILCCHSHNNLRSLIDVTKSKDGIINLVISDKATSLQDNPYYVDLICKYSIGASLQIHTLLKSSVQTEVARLAGEI
jgi:hypothetical protein